VPDAAHAKQLWPVLGRPGAVLAGGEIVGTWRPRKAGRTLTLAVQPWRRLSAAVHDGIVAQAQRLAAPRGLARVDVDVDGRRLTPAHGTGGG
jgi:hypothetical protein